MIVRLAVISGPHLGKEFVFDGRDSFLVGRSEEAHFQLSEDDPYFSRRHFVIELNPPRCRLLDLNSRNGVSVNGSKAAMAELADGDEIRAGHTTFRVSVTRPHPDQVRTLELPASEEPVTDQTVDHSPGTGPVPGYDLGSEIGRGGMGVVYRAVRRSDGVPAAVKTINPAPGSSRRQIAKFLREARILGSLAHPNVVTFFEAGEYQEGLFIAMELVNGFDTQKLVEERGPLSVTLAVRLACQALAGLNHAHDAGFVHRDVKPSNLLVGGPKGNKIVKVADFGLARAFESSQLSGMTLQGDIGGTPAFMPPEQVTHYRDVGPAADQYSVAATLYFLLTGRYAYDFGKKAGARLVQILTDDPIPIRKRRADLPESLASVIKRAMNREPRQRFPSLIQFRKALLGFGSNGRP